MAVIRTQFTLRLDPITHVKIKKIAVEESRTMNNMIPKCQLASAQKENRNQKKTSLWQSFRKDIFMPIVIFFGRSSL